MLLNLTRRLPVMILPKWTRNLTQSIDVRDVIRAIDLVLASEAYTGNFDIAGHPPMTYKDMILRTGELLGRKSVNIEVPANLFLLSRRWVSLFGSTPAHLVNPLLHSLRHSLAARPSQLLDVILAGAVPFDDSVRDSVDQQGFPLPNPREYTQASDTRRIRKAKRVRSLQRMPLPPGWSALRLSHTYSSWIRRATWGIINENRDERGVLQLSLVTKRIVLLELTPTPYSVNLQYRRAYYVTGGMLARKEDTPGRFELRIFPELGCLIAAIHGYRPRLPWWLYSCTQAVVHLIVMRAFGRYLGRICQELQKGANQPG
jgi:hypothetical protein